jgi:hypothetical protein
LAGAVASRKISRRDGRGQRNGEPLDELDLMRVVLMGVLLLYAFRLECSRQERQDRFLEIAERDHGD